MRRGTDWGYYGFRSYTSLSHQYIEGAQTGKLKVVTLLDKPDRRVVELEPDITGFVIPDRFVVGYGLDCAQKYRNLPYIGVISE